MKETRFDFMRLKFAMKSEEPQIVLTINLQK